jgi:3D-(3,5/4)-trihydroxycyclohexane-1,2-dione acylhydrolase (decyclizing)
MSSLVKIRMELERAGVSATDPLWTAAARAAHDEWLIQAEAFRTLEPNNDDVLPQSSVIGIINDTLADDAVIVAAAGSLPGDLLKLWRCKDETRKGYHLEYDASTMGYEIPGAIGVKLADPARHVVALLGDGSFLMNPTEILTAVQERLPVTIVVMDSKGHRSIQGCQEGNALQKFGTEYRMRNPKSGLLDAEPLRYNLVQVAEGLGAKVRYAKSADRIIAALEAARLDRARPWVIVIPMDAARTVPNFGWWDVPIPEVSDRPELQRKRSEYKEMLAQRVAR